MIFPPCFTHPFPSSQTLFLLLEVLRASLAGAAWAGWARSWWHIGKNPGWVCLCRDKSKEKLLQRLLLGAGGETLE